MEIVILIAVIVLGLSYAFLPQIFSLGLDDREPAARPGEQRSLEEEKEKWIQGIVDLETEREVGNIEEKEFKQLRNRYKKRAILAHQKLQHTEAPEDDADTSVDERIEASIEDKRSELAS